VEWAGVDSVDDALNVYSGEWAMGRIYEERGSRQHLRWYWSLLGILGKPVDLEAVRLG
jgi:hypothetical protein